MALVSMHGVSLAFGAGLLLDRIELNIEPGDRACLVGRNGTGKSSLMKILHGDVTPDSGDIRVRPDTRISYLPQDVPHDLRGSVEDIAASWAHNDHHAADAGGVHRSVGKVLSHLSLDAHARFEDLSGGQKRRVLIARALACEPDLLLLDEPTNHLDIESICWLEGFLLRHCKTFLFVTHDRAFLRRVANRIIDLDRGQLAHWSCDYDTFLRRKADLLHDEEVRNVNLDKKRSKEEAWIRQGIKARRTRNEGRVRQLVRMREEHRERRRGEGKTRLQVQTAERSGAKVIETTAMSFAYEPATPIVANMDLTIMRGDRIGIVGANGSGKTTLLKLFTGELQPTDGTVVTGTKLQIAYFDQHRAKLDDSKSVAENAGDGMDTIMLNGRPRHVISYLQDFLFTPDRARSPVSVLSGGERNRLLLAMLFARPSNLLVMDEPTNDLDTETLELLEEQLMDYSGTVLMVSHDRAFVDNVVTDLLIVRGNGLIQKYIGSYEDLLKSEKAAAAAAKQATAQTKRTPRSQPRFSYHLKRELRAIPGLIEKLETEQTDLHDRMVAPEYYKTEPEQIAQDKQHTDALITQLAEAYDRWEELERLQSEG